MATSHVKYLGKLRTEATHLRSSTKILTDAPIDNHGKGEAFSPTDLLATSLASCFISIIGIYCNENQIKMNGAEASVTKTMSTTPRRISIIEITFNFSMNNWDEETQTKLINVGKACPVAKSLSSDIKIQYHYNF